MADREVRASQSALESEPGELWELLLHLQVKGQSAKAPRAPPARSRWWTNCAEYRSVRQVLIKADQVALVPRTE